MIRTLWYDNANMFSDILDCRQEFCIADLWTCRIAADCRFLESQLLIVIPKMNKYSFNWYSVLIIVREMSFLQTFDSSSLCQFIWSNSKRWEMQCSVILKCYNSLFHWTMCHTRARIDTILWWRDNVVMIFWLENQGQRINIPSLMVYSKTDYMHLTITKGW